MLFVGKGGLFCHRGDIKLRKSHVYPCISLLLSMRRHHRLLSASSPTPTEVVLLGAWRWFLAKCGVPWLFVLAPFAVSRETPVVPPSTPAYLLGSTNLPSLLSSMHCVQLGPSLRNALERTGSIEAVSFRPLLVPGSADRTTLLVLPSSQSYFSTRNADPSMALGLGT